MIDPTAWKSIGVDALIVGSVKKLPDGRLDLRFNLHDTAQQKSLGKFSYVIAQSALRLTAHKIADYVYEKLLGEKGVFATRLAYVEKAPGRYRLIIADADGANPQVALASKEPIISPSWSPDGTQLAYVSFETRKPVVFVHTLATGRRKALANFKGSNSAGLVIKWSTNCRGFNQRRRFTNFLDECGWIGPEQANERQRNQYRACLQPRWSRHLFYV